MKVYYKYETFNHWNREDVRTVRLDYPADISKIVRSHLLDEWIIRFLLSAITLGLNGGDLIIRNTEKSQAIYYYLNGICRDQFPKFDSGFAEEDAKRFLDFAEGLISEKKQTAA